VAVSGRKLIFAKTESWPKRGPGEEKNYLYNNRTITERIVFMLPRLPCRRDRHYGDSEIALTFMNRTVEAAARTAIFASRINNK